MIDLFLTPRGDFAIEESYDNKKMLDINFVTSKSSALRVNFFIEDTYNDTINKNALIINFNVYKPKNDKEMKIIAGDAATEQAIKIRLLTALGTLAYNNNIGSKIETVIHEFVDSENTVSALKKHIKDAIKDIISDPVIKITKPETRYTDYSATLKVSIIDNNKAYNIML